MKLGELLRQRRELMGLTLRQVEEAIGQSNAYLSLLENGKIKKPSANVLYKLSTLYRVSLDELLIAAGVITPEQRIEYSTSGKSLNGIELTDEELKQLLSYLRFLRNERK
jgi:transcriptional regulator with XRE-family HTH domain